MRSRMRDLRTAISQFLIDFGEDRMMSAQSVGEERARKYGDSSWQWRWSFWQECFWCDFSYFSLMKI